METYKVPSHINPDKLFLVNRSELEGRLDPAIILYNRISQSFNFKIVKLKYLLKCKPQYGANESGIERTDINYPRYIRITDIDENGQLINQIGVTAENIESKYILNNNDILLARSGATVGKAFLFNSKKVKYPCFFAGYMIRFIIDDTKILPEYFFIYTQLKIYKNWVKYIQRIAGQPNINAEEYQSIKIPLPPLEIQQQIVDFYQNAYQRKQQKEAEAQALLESIDTYLLTELGIALPEKDNSLQNRIFTTMFSEISGGRLDPKLYDTNTTRLKRSLYNTDESTFIKSPLKKLIVQSISGDWGSEKVDDFDKQKYKKCLVIRATEFDNDYNLNLINPRIKFRLIKNEKLKKIDIQENDLLIEKSGGSPDQPVGRIAIIDNKIINENIICYSNFIHKIRINEKLINPKYLFSYLKTIYNIKLTESMQSQTNGIKNLIMSNYFNQTILIPKNQDNSVNFEKQNEIAEHIQQLRSRAKHLQEEAKNILEQAKQEVEKMILGE